MFVTVHQVISFGMTALQATDISNFSSINSHVKVSMNLDEIYINSSSTEKILAQMNWFTDPFNLQTAVHV